LLLLGGKVVKNAAGFDLPKFFVGSLGRFGVLAELTFKVFPQPPSRVTLKLKTENLASAGRILIEATSRRWEPEALDVPAGATAVYVRLGGPQKALGELAKDILERWPGEVLSAPEAGAFWSDIIEFRWAHPQGMLVKVALTPDKITLLTEAMVGLDGPKVHISAGGNMAFVSLRSTAQANTLNERVKKLGFSGLMLRGEGPLWIGKQSHTAILDAVKKALDPENRFPSLHD
jgi:glycolate oxidase FAD binding subunit